jgi:hypothetical protein
MAFAPKTQLICIFRGAWANASPLTGMAAIDL